MERKKQKRNGKPNLQQQKNDEKGQKGNQQQKQSLSLTADEIILNSLKAENHILAAHSEQQIIMLLAYIQSGTQVKIIPIAPNNRLKKLIEVYQIRDRALIHHRVVKKRANKNHQININQYPKIGFYFLFFVQINLLVNCIMLQIPKCSKLNISIGLNKTQINDFKIQEDGGNLDELLNLQQNNIKLYQYVQKCLQSLQNKKRQSQDFQISNGENKRVKEQNALLLSQLKQFIFDVNSQMLNIEQFAYSLQIMSYITSYIEMKANNIQKLYLNIFQFQKYGSQTQHSLILDKQICKINNLIKKVLAKTQDNKTKCKLFPRVIDISFNPMLIINQCQQQSTKQYKTNSQQKQQQCLPFMSLHLVSISQQINDKDYIMKLMRYVMTYFPKISHLYLNTTPLTLFKMFNELCAQLYKYCPLLESLYIYQNDPKSNKQPGLRDILSNYPYLSDLKIRLWPKLNQQNIPNSEYIREWEYIKQIQFRRIHIQRLLNTLKILEKQGYDKYQCISVMQFVKPLKFASLT